MKLFNKDILLEKGNVVDSINIYSYSQYKAEGGKHDMLDTYNHFKEMAKKYEGNYIMYMDQYLSGIDVPKSAIRENKLIAQVFWALLHLWFSKPLRIVNYNTFSLEEFNNL